MDADTLENGRVPTLVQLCQRMAVASLESIDTLGGLSYELAKPVLERCTAEQLIKLEDASPQLQGDTLELWMHLCTRKYPTLAEKYLNDDLLEPSSWRERYLLFRAEEERRLEQLGSKLRIQRLEAEERKKEREVKYTDKLPPPKRQKTGGGWGAPPQPKSLIRQALSDASKIQKSMYTSRMIPPMNNGKSYRVLPRPSCPIMPAPKPSNTPSRVTVNTVVHKHPKPGPSRPAVSKSAIQTPPPAGNPPSNALTRAACISKTSLPPRTTSPQKQAAAAAASGSSPDVRPIKPVKKDPMASLFVPKNRAYSQRPV